MKALGLAASMSPVQHNPSLMCQSRSSPSLATRPPALVPALGFVSESPHSLDACLFTLT